MRGKKIKATPFSLHKFPSGAQAVTDLPDVWGGKLWNPTRGFHRRHSLPSLSAEPDQKEVSRQMEPRPYKVLLGSRNLGPLSLNYFLQEMAANKREILRGMDVERDPNETSFVSSSQRLLFRGLIVLSQCNCKSIGRKSHLGESEVCWSISISFRSISLSGHDSQSTGRTCRVRAWPSLEVASVACLRAVRKEGVRVPVGHQRAVQSSCDTLTFIKNQRPRHPGKWRRLVWLAVRVKIKGSVWPELLKLIMVKLMNPLTDKIQFK